MVDRKAFRFFRDHAGYVVGERAKGALALAKAEAEAERRGIRFVWEWDAGADASWMTEDEQKEEHEAFWARAEAPCGECGRPEVLASLGGIFDPDQNYVRVVNAELAMEAIA